MNGVWGSEALSGFRRLGRVEGLGGLEDSEALRFCFFPAVAGFRGSGLGFRCFRGVYGGFGGFGKFRVIGFDTQTNSELLTLGGLDPRVT